MTIVRCNLKLPSRQDKFKLVRLTSKVDPIRVQRLLRYYFVSVRTLQQVQRTVCDSTRQGLMRQKYGVYSVHINFSYMIERK